MAGRGARFSKIIASKTSTETTTDSGLGTTTLPSATASAPSRTNATETADVRSKLETLSITSGILPPSPPDPTPASTRPRGRGRGILIEKIKELSEKAKTLHPPSTTLQQDRCGSGLSSESLPSTGNASVATPEPVVARGKIGKTVEVGANYIRLQSDKDCAVYEYEVRFEPVISAKPLRTFLLKQHLGLIGDGYLFDGVALILPKLLEESITHLESTSRDGKKYKLMLLFKKKMRLGESVKVYNHIFDRIMKILKYVRHNRKQFDPTRPILIPQQRLEVWPGHITSVNEFEDGLMCNLDVSFRLLNTETVLEKLREIYHINPVNFQKQFKDTILGLVVLTRYNNKTYRVDDILWDQNPMTKFETTSGEEITFKDYYWESYQIEIQDLKQPLLVHYETKRISGKKFPEERKMCLIPEICYLTGLTDLQRQNFKVMKDIASHTRVTPNQRAASMKKFIENVNENEEARKLLANWGLKLDESIVHLDGRVLPEQSVQFHGQLMPVGNEADFNRAIGRAEVIHAVNIDRWLLVYPKREQNTARTFVHLAKRNSGPLGITVQDPIICELNSDSTDAYVIALRQRLERSLQLVMIIVPTQRNDRYSAIKRVVCCECPIPSQVLLTKTLANERTARNVVLRVLLQINCKIGGSLWSIPIPLKNVMIIGVDTFHSADKKSPSVAAFVASMNGNYTKWFSRAVIQDRKEEMMNGLAQSLRFALKEYRRVSNYFFRETGTLK